MGILSPLVHMEMAVPDAEQAFWFLHQSLGAKKVQEEFAAFLQSTNRIKVIHVGLGDFVLQFIQPLQHMGSWSRLLAAGAGVHNLTFGVQDVDQVVDRMARHGTEPLFSFAVDWSKISGEKDLNSKTSRVYMMDTMAKLGFHLELSESTDGSSPALLAPPKEPIGAVASLMHITVLIPWILEAADFLHQVFGAQPMCPEPAHSLKDIGLQVQEIQLGNVLVRYCQPQDGATRWQKWLQTRGSGVHSVGILINDASSVSQTVNLGSLPLAQGSSLEMEAGIGPGPSSGTSPVILNTAEILGFNLEFVYPHR